MPIVEKVVNNYSQGVIDTVASSDIPDSATSAELNWMTMGSQIELRRGQTPIGTESASAGKITGIYTAIKADGSQITFRKNGRKLEYFDVGAGATDWAETGTNMFPAAAVNDDAAFASYNTNAGNQLFVSSVNGSVYKILVANPGSFKDQGDATQNFSGQFKMKITQNRMLAWGRLKDKTGVYGSYIDTQTYTTVSAEAYGTGDGATKTFAHTAAALTGKRTGFGFTVTDGNELFTDNYNGVLTGSLGGSGTVNYVTGAISVTFNTAPTNSTAITTTYQWEDSTVNGVCDFTHANPRLAGQGFVFRQDEDGSDMQNSFTYNSVEYCFHKLRTWELNITQTDTAATNLPYRARIGISNWRGGVATGTAVYFVNDIDKNNITLQKISLNVYSTSVIPTTLSQNVDQETNIILGAVLDNYVFDQAAAIEYGNLIVIACRTSDSTTNNRVITYNKLTNAIDYHDFTVSCFAINGSDLWSGDSVSPNVFKLFNGFDDDNNVIPNFWESKKFALADEYIAKCKKLIFQGAISTGQAYNVYASIDDGPIVLIGQISGTGAYVDQSAPVSVTIGMGSVGGNDVGGNSKTIEAFNYEHALPLKVGKLVHIKLHIEAIGVGYVSVSQTRFFDIQTKSLRVLSKYA